MRPIVLCFSGFDPTGGAGIQADIESITATGAKAMTVITAITSQNTQGVYAIKPISNKWLSKQVEPILQEFEISAIKIGMCAKPKTAKAIAKIIHKLSDVPVILDPVLSSGSGEALGTDDLARAIYKFLLPLSTVITPNLAEINHLCSKPNLQDKIHDIKYTGCKNILLTNTDNSEYEDKVNHQWFGEDGKVKDFTYPMLDGMYHGSGCTLASSLASYIAQKKSYPQAVKMALDYTWDTLDKSYTKGHMQKLPNRHL